MHKIFFAFALFTILGCEEQLTKKTIKTFPSGAIEEQHYFDKEGRVRRSVQYFENGNIKIEGSYNTDGNRDGTWKAFYEDGTLWSVGEYRKGRQHGVNRVNFPNGQTRYEGSWTNDRKTGIWNFYDENGGLVKSEDLSKKPA